jgi:hypothetical protein
MHKPDIVLVGQGRRVTTHNAAADIKEALHAFDLAADQFVTRRWRLRNDPSERCRRIS